MKILIIGASGAVGTAAVEALSARHEIVSAGRASGHIHVDIENVGSIHDMYRQTGNLDAVITTVGSVHFGPVSDLTGKQFMQSVQRKVLPQVNVVLVGIDYVNDGGSFTVTSGVSNRDPVRGGAAAGAANGALDGFVTGAAVDLPRGIRINAVSPEALEDSRYRHPDRFYGHAHVSNEAVGLAYSKAVEGCLSGRVFIVD